MSDFRKWECVICGFIYDEAEGLPDDGIAPGTKWEDVPEDWECPDCGISKFDFDLMEADQRKRVNVYQRRPQGPPFFWAGNTQNGCKLLVASGQWLVASGQ